MTDRQKDDSQWLTGIGITGSGLTDTTGSLTTRFLQTFFQKLYGGIKNGKLDTNLFPWTCDAQNAKL